MLKLYESLLSAEKKKISAKTYILMRRNTFRERESEKIRFLANRYKQISKYQAIAGWFDCSSKSRKLHTFTIHFHRSLNNLIHIFTQITFRTKIKRNLLFSILEYWIFVLFLFLLLTGSGKHLPLLYVSDVQQIKGQLRSLSRH